MATILAALLLFVLTLSGCAGVQQSAYECDPSGGFGGGVTNALAPIAPQGSDWKNEVKLATQGNVRLAASMFWGASVESKGDPSAKNPWGAFGLFQIQSPGVVNNDITVEQALNGPYAVRYMLPRYRKALSTIDPSLWASNPQQALESVAFAAEQPAVRYSFNRSKADIDGAYQYTLKWLAEVGLTADWTTGDTIAVVPEARPVAAQCNQYGGQQVAGAVGKVLEFAKSQLGVPYVWGGMTAGVGVDCSGFVTLAYKAMGIDLRAHRFTVDMWNYTKKWQVPAGQEQAGDIVFFNGYLGQNGPGHVGIVTDAQRKIMINAPTSGDVVKYESYAAPGRANDLVGFTRPAGGSSEPPGSATAPSNPAPGVRPVIVLDPGHGDAPNQPLVDGVVVDDYASTTPEMGQVYDVAVEVRKQLEALGYDVRLTKSSKTQGVNLYERAKVASDARAALLVNLHTDPGLKEVQVYYPQIGGIRFRADGTEAPAYNNESVSAASKTKAEGMASAFTANGVPAASGTYDKLVGWRTISDKPPRMQKGNILTVSYYANVPNIYVEYGLSGGGLSLSDDAASKYAKSIVEGVKKTVPLAVSGQNAA